jgi:hypothetical protein
MKTLGQLQTFVTPPYIIASTAERKTSPKVKNTLQYCCNAHSTVVSINVAFDMVVRKQICLVIKEQKIIS